MKIRNYITIAILVPIMIISSMSVAFAEGSSTQSTYTGSYDVEFSTNASGKIVLQGVFSDSTLTAEEAIDFNPKLTTSGTLNKTYCFSLRINSLAEGCSVKSIKVDFEDTGLSNANAHNVSLSQSSDEYWSCTLNGNTSGGYVSLFTITLLHSCSYTSEETIPSTCTEHGTVSDVCSCGHKEIKATLDLIDHSYGEWEIINEPTAINTGLRQRTCSTCGNVDEEVIPSLENILDSGSYADITWYINTEYKLVITGSGPHLGGYTGQVPWYDYKDQIKSLVVDGEIRLVSDFMNYTALESVEIKGGVKEIGTFDGCTSLRTVKLPKTFWIINNNTFYGCTSLEEVVFPETVDYIGSGAFYGCTSLSGVVLPTNLEYIPENCFKLCTSLSSIEIPKSVERINDGAFADCSNLKDVYFKGASPNAIGNDAFSGTSNDLIIHYDPDTRGWEDNDIWDGYTLKPYENSSIGDEKYDYAEVKLAKYYYNIDNDYSDPPEVYVFNYKGKKLISGTDYQVTYDITPYTQGDHNVRVRGIAPFTFDKTVSYSVLAGNVLEWNSTAPYGSVYFSKSDDEHTLVIFGSGSMRDVVSTSSYGSYTLPGYCYNANDSVYMKGVTTVVIDEGVTSIGRASFASYYASNGSSGWFPDLKTVIVPSSVTTIKASGIYPFSNSELLESVYIYSKDAELADDSIHAEVIYGYPNSTAQSYASKNNIVFHPICEYHDVVIINKIDPTCTTKGYSGDYKCLECGEILRNGKEIDALGHDFHEQEDTAIEPTCTQDGKTADKKCSRCNETEVGEPIPASHDLITHSAKESTCAEHGNIEYLKCRVCEKLFARETPDSSLTEISIEDTILPLKQHSWNSTYTVDKKATYSTAGSKSYHCSTCNAANPDSAVAIPKLTAKLATTSYTYDGKVKAPAVTVKSGTKTLTKNNNYTVTYASGRKSVGTYKVTVKMKSNDYSGSKTLSFKINPKGTTLLTPVAASKAITVKWRRQAAKMAKSVITGYKIQLATDSAFTKNKKQVTVKGYSNVSKKVTRLLGGKKYYIRICTYKTVGDKTYCSPWSAKKYITTKK